MGILPDGLFSGIQVASGTMGYNVSHCFYSMQIKQSKTKAKAALTYH